MYICVANIPVLQFVRPAQRSMIIYPPKYKVLQYNLRLYVKTAKQLQDEKAGF